MPTEHLQKVLIGFKMIVFRVEDHFADAVKHLGEHGGGAGLGGALFQAAALAHLDEGPLKPGDLGQDEGHLLVGARVASMAEAVEVAPGRAGAAAASAPLLLGGR